MAGASFCTLETKMPEIVMTKKVGYTLPHSLIRRIESDYRKNGQGQFVSAHIAELIGLGLDVKAGKYLPAALEVAGNVK